MCGPLAAGVEVAAVRQGVQQVLTSSALIVGFRPSLLALALLSLLLEKNKLIEEKCPLWLSVAIGLQALFQVNKNHVKL